jgi:DNA-binding transcriptional ArsR family regulator
MESGHDVLPGLFSALADPHRLAIVERLLAEGDLTVGELAKPFAISAPAISRHIAVLEAAGLVERRIDRQWRVLRVRPEGLLPMQDWVEEQRRFWRGAMRRLERHLDDNRRNKGDE